MPHQVTSYSSSSLSPLCLAFSFVSINLLGHYIRIVTLLRSIIYLLSIYLPIYLFCLLMNAIVQLSPPRRGFLSLLPCCSNTTLFLLLHLFFLFLQHFPLLFPVSLSPLPSSLFLLLFLFPFYSLPSSLAHRELAFQIQKEYERFSKYLPDVKSKVFYGGTYVIFCSGCTYIPRNQC